jgi:formate hydrogenlyase subunit 3/multisubunit Na+/H+ antiporter MnhD subunit
MIVHPMALSIWFPLLAGLVCLLIPRHAQRTRSVVAVVSAALAVVPAWALLSQRSGLLEPAPWLLLRVDALSAFVLLGVTLFGFLIALYSVGYMKDRERHREYFAYLLWTVGVTCGAVLANDLLLLLIFWGFLALTLYLMIGIAGPGAAEAARKSLMIVGGSDALLLFGVVLVWHLSGSTRMDGAALSLDGPAAHIAFLAFAAAAFAKAGAVPFHSCVPDCGEKADVPVSAFLPASLDKLLGIYLLTRVVMDLFEPTPAMRTLLMLIGATTVLAAVMMALVQHDLKRLLAYHAVSQVGYMVLGIGTGTAIGLAGGLFHMINHAIYKSCLFLCAGTVEKAAGTTDLDRLGGLGKAMPLTFATFTVAALSISGIPPLNGFASKWMIYQGIITSGEAGGVGWIVWLVVAMFGSTLTLASFVKVLHATFLCKPAPDIARRSIREAGLPMVLPLIVLAALCVVFGVFPFSVPLDWLIFPVLPADVPGVWWAGLATILILAAIALGLILYAVTMASGRLRRVETYIGGERLDEVYIRGETPGQARHVEVTGADFYDTIEQLPALDRLYMLARRKVFDIYELGADGSRYFVDLLRSAHTGVLPSYLTWFLIGLVAVAYVITQSGC